MVWAVVGVQPTSFAHCCLPKAHKQLTSTMPWQMRTTMIMIKFDSKEERKLLQSVAEIGARICAEVVDWTFHDLRLTSVLRAKERCMNSRLFRHALAAAASGLLLSAFAPVARAEIPINLPEQVTMAKLPAIDGQRVYVSDPTMNHIVDGRMHVLDGGKMRYLGLIGSGFAGLITLSHDKRFIYVATAYHSRLQRGTRTDVVEVYRTEDLGFDHEIVIPPKRVQGLQIKALTTMSPDDRYLFIQNATPATSITVVDLKERRVTAEFANPGCWGVLPWPNKPRRVTSICGDGTTTNFDINDKGELAATTAGPAFFKPDVDPVFMHYEAIDDRLIFVSYNGMVYTVRMTDNGLQADGEPWALVDSAAAKKGWRPGGFQLFAVDPAGKRLVVGMHEAGAEGSHKNPASELWVFDLATHKRIGKLPGEVALSMTFAPKLPKLFVLSAADNRIVSFDLSGPRLPKRPMASSLPVGETPVYLVLQ